MRTRWRVGLIIALLLLGTYAALPTLSEVPALRAWITARLERATAWQVGLQRFRVGHDLSAHLGSLSVAQAGRASAFLTADRVDISLHPLRLFSGQALRVRVEGPHLYVAELPAPSAEAGTGPAGALEHAEIVDAYIHVPAGDTEAVIGPLSLAVDGLVGEPGQLALSGHGPLPGEANTLTWSAALGSTLATSHGSITVDAATPMDAVRAWIGAPLPPALSPTAATARLDWRGTDAGAITLDIEAAVQVPSSDGGVHLAGGGEIDPRNGDARVKLSGAKLAFHSADASRAASGIDASIALAAQRTAAGVTADFELNVPTGEILWDRFYVDLRHHRLALRGRAGTSATRLTLERGTLSIGGIGSIAGSGSYDLDRQQERWRAELDLPGLAAAYELAVREPLQADYPLLSRLDVRGRVAGVIERGRLRSGARHTTGFIDLVGVTVQASEPRVDVVGLDAHLPLDLSDDDSRSGAGERGLIRIRDLGVGDAAIGGVALPLHVERNRIALAEAVRIAMLGGALELAEIDVTQLMSDEPHARLALAVRDLDLAAVSRAAGWPVLSGRMMGTIPALTIDPHSVQSDGEIRVDVFGGNVRLRNLRVDELLSPVPTVRLDLDIADLSLAQLTNTFEVGRISGVAAGGVRGLEIANGQPARFDAWLETVERRGVPQRISVTAVRQLSILGGTGGDPISSGVLGFFDEYRYAKMGFRCRLENDQFVLRGVEEKDGAEYLVVGTTLPPRVNVISHTRVFSFSELVRRLARVSTLKEGGQRTDDDNPPGSADDPAH